MIEFLFALRAFCAEALANINLQSLDRGELPEVKLFIGEIPGELETPRASDFPLVILRLAGFEDPAAGTMSTLTLRILVGTYCEEESNDDRVSPGYHDMLNMLQRLRQALLKTPHIGRWRRTGKLEGGPFETQAYPYWFGDIIARYDERQTTEEFCAEEEINIYGSGYGNDDTRDWRYPS